jgi:hypothetical protein
MSSGFDRYRRAFLRRQYDRLNFVLFGGNLSPLRRPNCVFADDAVFEEDRVRLKSAIRIVGDA